MRVADAITYEIAGGAPVTYYGMTPTERTSSSPLISNSPTMTWTPAPTYYMWSEAGTARRRTVDPHFARQWEPRRQ